MTLKPANLNRPAALRVNPADLQATYALRAGGPALRDQVLLLTRAPARRETNAPTTLSRRAPQATPSQLTRPRACA